MLQFGVANNEEESQFPGKTKQQFRANMWARRITAAQY
jgi:hypothetical protein